MVAPSQGDADGSPTGGSSDAQVGTGGEQQQQPAAGSEEETYRQRYETLRGKYQKEVAPLKRQVADAQAAFAQAYREVQTLREQVQRQVQQPVAPSQPAASSEIDPNMFDAKLREEYGDDLLKAVAQVANRRLEAELSQRLQPFQQMHEQVQASAQAAFDQRVWADPVVRELNDDPLFAEWLDKPVMPGVNFTPRQQLEASKSIRDAEGVLGVFHAFNKTSPVAAAQRLAAGEVLPETKPTPVQKQTPAPVKSMTQGEWDAGMNRVMALHRRHEFAAAQKLEQELNRAMEEGRVK